jgi:hypothetical protein
MIIVGTIFSTVWVKPKLASERKVCSIYKIIGLSLYLGMSIFISKEVEVNLS